MDPLPVSALNRLRNAGSAVRGGDGKKVFVFSRCPGFCNKGKFPKEMGRDVGPNNCVSIISLPLFTLLSVRLEEVVRPVQDRLPDLNFTTE